MRHSCCRAGLLLFAMLVLAAAGVAPRAAAQVDAPPAGTPSAPARPAPAAPAPSASAPPVAPRLPAASRVVLLTTGADDAIVREAATRLAAELGAAGFEVVRIPREPGGDLRADMERAAQEAGAFAAAAIFRSGEGATADLWIVDRVTRKTVVRTVEVDGTAAPSVLAVRTVELLQASLLEASDPSRTQPGPGRPVMPGDVARWMEPPAAPPPAAPPPAAPPAAPPPAAPPPAAPPRRPGLLDGVALEAGLTLLQSAGGVGPAVGPGLRLSLGGASALPAGLAGRLMFVGPAVAPALEGAAGSVSVRQELAALELVYALDAGTLVVPLVSIGAGAYHLRAAGAPDPPRVDAQGDVWSLLAQVGAGVGIRLTDRAALVLDARALVLEPRPVVLLAGEQLGTAGRPTLTGFLGVLVRL